MRPARPGVPKPGRNRAKLEAIERKLDEQSTQLASLRESINNVATKADEQFQMVAKACALQVGKLTAQLGANIHSLDDLDTNFLASVKVVKELVGQIVMLGAQLRILDPNTPMALPSDKPLEERVDGAKIVEEAKAWYIELINDALNTVKLEKEQHEKEQREKAEATARAHQAAQDLIDAATTARAKGTLEKPTTAGPGSDHPEGAQIFGG